MSVEASCQPSPERQGATRSEQHAVIEAYKRSIDRSLLRENLRLTVEERFRKLQQMQCFAAELRRAAREAAHDRF